MKRILSVLLVIVTLALSLCSCGKPDFAYGEYESKGEGNTVYLELKEDGRAHFNFFKGKKLAKRAEYTYDKSEEILTVQIFGTSETIAFKVEEDKLIFVSNRSSVFPNDDGSSKIQDGLELYYQ